MRVLRAQTGSILPLVIGYGLLGGTLLIVTVGITDLYTHQRRVDGLAAAAALAAADGFVLEPGPSARLDIAAADLHAQAVLDAAAMHAEITELASADGTTVSVSIVTAWEPPLGSALFPEGVALGSTGTARTAIR